MVSKRLVLVILVPYLLMIIGSTILLADAPLREWVARTDGPVGGNQYGRSATLDASGNIYTTGSTPGTGGDFHFLTAKYDTAGNEIWAAVYDGPGAGHGGAYDIAVDGAGNVFVVGTIAGASGNRDHVVVKYDSAGNELWALLRNGPGNGEDYAHNVELDAAGNVFVCGGIFVGGYSNTDMIVTRYDNDGNEIWSSTYNGPGNEGDGGTALTLDGSGYLYASGTSTGLSSYDYALVKFDTDGNQIWVARYDGPGAQSDKCTSHVLNGTGQVVVTGESYSSVWTYADIGTVAFSVTDGSFLWDAHFDAYGSEDQPMGLATDGAGNIYVTGFSSTDYGYVDITTLKYDAAGNELWAVLYDGPTRGDDWGEGVVVDSAGNAYVTGDSESTAGNYTDFMTIKYDTNGNMEWLDRYNHTGTGYDGGDALVAGPTHVYAIGWTYGAVDGDMTTIKYRQSGVSVVDCTLTCVPASGTIPFTTTITARLFNVHTAPRVVAARVDLQLANGSWFSNYRKGSTNLAGGAVKQVAWPQALNGGTVIGTNFIQLAVQDVSPPPYNQPPRPPAGDLASATCAVVATQ